MPENKIENDSKSTKDSFEKADNSIASARESSRRFFEEVRPQISSVEIPKVIQGSLPSLELFDRPEENLERFSKDQKELNEQIVNWLGKSMGYDSVPKQVESFLDGFLQGLTGRPFDSEHPREKETDPQLEKILQAAEVLIERPLSADEARMLLDLSKPGAVNFESTPELEELKRLITNERGLNWDPEEDTGWLHGMMKALQGKPPTGAEPREPNNDPKKEAIVQQAERILGRPLSKGEAEQLLDYRKEDH